MDLRQLLGPLAKFGVCAAAALAAGCANYPSGTIPIRASRPISLAELPGGSGPAHRSVGAALSRGERASVRPAAAPQTPPSPVVLAMGRATSYFDRGNQAMRDGKADQAEWEFDAAFEALLSATLAGKPSGRLLEGPPPLASLPSAWLLRVPTSATLAASEASDEPDEPNQEAPALLGPEDLKELGQSAAESGAIPELEGQQYGIPIVFNDQVKTFIRYFSTHKWQVVTRAFERARLYLPMMRQIFQEKDLPEELISLAFIESAVNPWATSKAKAAGIWQFIPSTGRLYGMRVGWWLDERRDPEKSTRGAAAYLKNLYQMFDSWPLALAAYNAGEGAIQRAIERQRSRDFWKLRLPKETQLFVPAFMAMTVISRNPERYGFSPPPPEPHATEIVQLSHPTDLRLIAKAARTTPEHVRELNPALIRWATPPDHPRFSLRIPAGAREEFEEALAKIPAAQRLSLSYHKVRRGDTSAGIAKRYRVSHQALLEMNGLVKRQPLKPGTTLMLPDGARRVASADAAAPGGRRSNAAPPAKPQKHTVKAGDTLGGIAKRYQASVGDLCRWNDLQKNVKLRPGQQLTVASPERRRESAAEKPSQTRKAQTSGGARRTTASRTR